jgi:hypothetical protein
MVFRLDMFQGILNKRSALIDDGLNRLIKAV